MTTYTTVFSVTYIIQMDALEETPKDAMDVLEDLMSKRKWKKQCLRANVAQPEDIVTYGTVKVAKIYSNVLNKREKEPELYDAIKDIAPEWWGEDTQITLNKDPRCKRHRDHGNKEHSWILWLGDYTGGDLHFDDGACQGRWEEEVAQDQRTYPSLE